MIGKFIGSSEKLCVKVIKAIHGPQIDGFSPPIKPSSGGEWASINRVIIDLHNRFPVTSSLLLIKVGNGLDTCFWMDTWIGKTSLSARFPRMFALELNKTCKIANRRSINGVWDWHWRRDPRPGIESQQFNDMLDCLAMATFSNSPDSWTCPLFKDGRFSVSGFRKLIIADQMGEWPTHWCNIIPPKVNFFLWRARLDRLPDKCNLLDRGVVASILLCSSCNIQIEDSSHIFFDCEVATQVWSFVAQWLEIDIPRWQNFDAFWQWCMASSNDFKKVMVTEVVCYAALWTIWRYRNGVIFNPNKFRKCHLLDSVVFSSYDWISSRYKKARLNWNLWLLFPLMSL
ncbi:uncharacterized protein [Rutidosis leptorrhynchoides]|uniref:uncharacterized protein n=1 Tax=Rutidosis leptorrhynchoides TaxID=125765 RepID=UPI003A9A2E6B